jgi:hypothetical protein
MPEASAAPSRATQAFTVSWSSREEACPPGGACPAPTREEPRAGYWPIAFPYHHLHDRPTNRFTHSG